MAYKSVLWTAKTPITSDRLAQMQENIEVLRSMLEGNQQYVAGAPMGAGKGILHYQEITTQVEISNTVFVQVGQSFTPKTEAGRRYLFEVYFPRVHSYYGGVGFTLYKDAEAINSFWVGTNSNAWEAFAHSFAASMFANAGYGATHIVPGYNITSSYSVKGIAYLNNSNGLVYADANVRGFIKFTDVGPAL